MNKNVCKNELINIPGIMNECTNNNTVHPSYLINIMIKIITSINYTMLAYQKRFGGDYKLHINFDPWLFISMTILALEG